MQLLTARQAADRLAVSERTVRRLVQRGALCGVKIGSSRRFDELELARFVASLSPSSPSPSGSLPDPISVRQRAALHAKAGDLDRKLERRRGESKRLALGWATSRFGREVTGSSELSFEEASAVLDWLEDQLRDGQDWTD